MAGGLQPHYYEAIRQRFYFMSQIPQVNPRRISVLYLKKGVTYWGHRNFIRNDEQLLGWIHEVGLDVTTIEPSKMNINEQIFHLSRSLLVVSLWGGVHMLDILQPPGSVEILFTAWNKNEGYIRGNKIKIIYN